jgi:hypothetical protein
MRAQRVLPAGVDTALFRVGQHTTDVIIAGGPLRPFYAWYAFVPGAAEARRSRSGTATRDLTAHRDGAGIDASVNNPGQQSLLWQAAMNRFFVPT